MPPLRERREDIEPLAQYILQKIAGPNAPELAPQAVDALVSYSWTGNVRQLRNCLERAVLLADNGRITTKELPPEVVYRTNEPSVSVNFSAPKRERDQFFSQVASPTALHEVEKQQILQRSRTNRLASRQNGGNLGNFVFDALPSPARIRAGNEIMQSITNYELRKTNEREVVFNS